VIAVFLAAEVATPTAASAMERLPLRADGRVFFSSSRASARLLKMFRSIANLSMCSELRDAVALRRRCAAAMRGDRCNSSPPRTL
jgi:hypothetical protein